MMEEYVKKRDVLETLRTVPDYDGIYSNDRINYNIINRKMTINAIQLIMAEDVRPVLRGTWIPYKKDNAVCSRCKDVIDLTDGKEHNFCQKCGADMRVWRARF